MTVLRVMTYNVRSLRDDRAAVSRVIRAARPDVVCLQEAPRFLRWRTLSAELARRSGLVVITGGRPASGNLLLCQVGVEVEHCASARLAPVSGLHQRGMAVAVCRLRGRRFGLVGMHLDLAGPARLAHARELLDRLPALGVPTDLPRVVAGDVNEIAGEPAWALLAEHLGDVAAAAGCDTPTFSTANPRRCIDGIFADPRIIVRSCEVLDSPDVRIASDHRPVLAELDLPE